MQGKETQVLSFSGFLRILKVPLFTFLLTFGSSVYAVVCPDGQVEQINPFSSWADCGISTYGDNDFGTVDDNGNWYANFNDGSRDFVSIRGTAYCLAEERSIPTEPTGTCGTYPLPIVDEVNINASGNHCWCHITQYKPFSTSSDLPYQNVYAKYIQLPDTDNCSLNSCAERCARISSSFNAGIGGDLIHDVNGLRGDIYKSVKNCRPIENKITYIDDAANNVIYNIQDYTPGTSVTLLTHLNKDKFIFMGWCETPGCNNPKAGGTSVSGLSGEKTYYAKWQQTDCDTGVVAMVDNGVVTCTSQCAEGFEQQNNPFTGMWSNCDIKFNGMTGSSSATGEWSARFNFRDFSFVKGQAYCLEEQYSMPSQKGVCNTNALPIVENVDKGRIGNVCWCQVTAWQPFSTTGNAPFQQVSTKYIQLPVTNECNLQDCGSRCARIGDPASGNIDDNTHNNVGLRGDVFKSVKKCVPIEYTFTFDVGENGVEIDPLKYTFNDLPFDLPTPSSSDNKIFVGWYENENLSGDPITKIRDISHGTKTLYARWTNECAPYQKPVLNPQGAVTCVNACNMWEHVQNDPFASYKYGPVNTCANFHTTDIIDHTSLCSNPSATSCQTGQWKLDALNFSVKGLAFASTTEPSKISYYKKSCNSNGGFQYMPMADTIDINDKGQYCWCLMTEYATRTSPSSVQYGEYQPISSKYVFAGDTTWSGISNCSSNSSCQKICTAKCGYVSKNLYTESLNTNVYYDKTDVSAQTVNLRAAIYESVNQCAPNEYTITFNSNGGSDVNSITYTYNDLPMFLPELFKQNQDFVGWFDNNNNKITKITTTNYGNKTLTARWTEKTCQPYEEAVFDDKGNKTCEKKCETWQYVQKNPFLAGLDGKALTFANKPQKCQGFINGSSCSPYTPQSLPNNYWQAAFPVYGIHSVSNFVNDTVYMKGIAITSAQGPTEKISASPRICNDPGFWTFLPTANDVEFDPNGQHCWCKLTDYGEVIPYGVDNLHTVFSKYVYSGKLTGTAANPQTCPERCQQMLCNTNDVWFGTSASSAVNKATDIYTDFGGQIDGPYGIRATMMTAIKQCASNQYTIAYRIDGENVSNLNPQTYYPGDGLLTLPTPTLEAGKTFLGWCDDGTTTCETPLNGTISTGEETNWIGDKILNAKWEYNSYKIKYEHGTAGDRTTGFTGTMDYTGTIYKTNVSLRENAFGIPGYTFDGWLGDYNNTNGSLAQTSYENGENLNPYNIANDLTLIAQWVADDYVINYTCGTGQFKEGINSYSQTPTFDSSYLIANVADVCDERSGYEMNGWECDYSLPNEKWTLLTNVNCVAQWAPKSYDIRYENIESSNNPYNPTTYLTGQVITLKNPIDKTGYEFKGWFTNAEYEPNSRIYQITDVPANNETFIGPIYAKFEPRKYDIVYHLDGGNFAVGTVHPDYYYISSSSITIPDPIRNGYTFDGWYTDSDLSVPAETTIPTNSTGNRDFYAKWNLNSYTVIYNVNGGENLTNDTYSVESTLILPTPTRDGYKFQGWYDNAEFEGAAITTLPIEPIDAETLTDKTLYAKWEEIVYFNIVYKDQNGDDIVLPVTAVPEDGEELSALPTPPVSRGFTFDGWCTDAECENSEPIMEPDENWPTSQDEGEPITLYPKYSEIKYPIIYHDVIEEEWPVLANHPEEYTVTSSAVTIGKPMRLGYNFVQWCTNKRLTENCEESPTIDPDEIDPLAGVVLYPDWALNTYTITYETNDGTLADKSPLDYSMKKSVTLKNPSRENYVFKGWYDNAEFNGEEITTLPVEPINAETLTNKTLYAKWQTRKYILNYDCGFVGETPVTYNSNETRDVFITGQSYTLISGTTICKTPSNFTFDGWKCPDELGTSGTWTYTQDQYCVAQWKRTACDDGYVATGETNNNGEPICEEKAADPVDCPTGYFYQVNPFEERWGRCENIAQNPVQVNNAVDGANKGRFIIWFGTWDDIPFLKGQSLCLADDGERPGMPANEDSGSCATTYTIRSDVDTTTSGKHCWCNFDEIASGSFAESLHSPISKPLHTKYIKITDPYNTNTVENCQTSCVISCMTANKDYDDYYANNPGTLSYKIKNLRRALYKAVRQCAPISYSIWYVWNNTYSNTHVEDNATLPKNYNIETRTLTLPNLVQSGHEFLGWCEDSSLSKNCTIGTKTFPEGTMGNKTFYAKWRKIDEDTITCPKGYSYDTELSKCAPVEYTIQYMDTKGATSTNSPADYTVMNAATNNENNPSTYTVEDNIVLQPASKPGYDFIGWRVYKSYHWHDITEIPLGSTENQTIYAQFSTALVCGEDEEKIHTSNGWKCSPQTNTVTLKDIQNNVLNILEYSAEEDFVLPDADQVLTESGQIQTQPEGVKHYYYESLTPSKTDVPVTVMRAGSAPKTSTLYTVPNVETCDANQYKVPDTTDCEQCPVDSFPNSDGNGFIGSCYATCPKEPICPEHSLKCSYVNEDILAENNYLDYYDVDNLEKIPCKIEFDCDTNYHINDNNDACVGDSYTIKYFDDENEIVALTEAHVYGTETVLPTELPDSVTNPYHTFGGWKNANGEMVETIAGTTIPSNGEFAFYINWIPEHYNIEYFDGNNQIDLTPTTYTYGDSINNIPNGAIPTKPKFEIVAWCTDSGLQNCAEKQSVSSTDSGDKTFYAKWNRTECDEGYEQTGLYENGEPICSEKFYTVNYEIDGVDYTPESGITTNYRIGDTITLPSMSVPSKPNSIFAGWCDADAAICEHLMDDFVASADNGWMGDKTLTASWTEDKFQLTTTDNINKFDFSLAASGVFYVDWGDGDIQKIDRTNNTEYEIYSHDYENAGSYTLHFGGEATGYNETESFIPTAIRFYTVNSVKSVSGSLGRIFKTIGNGGTLATQPRFNSTFMAQPITNVPANLFTGINDEGVHGVGVAGMFASTFNTTNLTSIPSQLFSGITNNENSSAMYSGTFENCVYLQQIPYNLFNNLAVYAPGLFTLTFSDCTNLRLIPENLFAHITGNLGTNTFNSTFYNCTNVIGFADNNGNLTTNYIPTNYMDNVNVDSLSTNIMIGMFAGTQLLTSCPSGTAERSSPFAAYWAPKVSCKPCDGGTCPYLIIYYDGDKQIHSQSYPIGYSGDLYQYSNSSLEFYGWCVNQDLSNCDTPLTVANPNWDGTISLYAKLKRLNCSANQYMNGSSCANCPEDFPTSDGTGGITTCYVQCDAPETWCPNENVSCRYSNYYVDENNRDYYKENAEHTTCEHIIGCSSDNYVYDNGNCIARQFNIEYFDGNQPINLTPKKYTFGTGLSSLPTPQKQHYDFTGWIDEENRTVTGISTEDFGNKKFYATWTPKQYNIRFEPETPFAKSTYTINDTPFNLPGLPIVSGLTVTGWYTDSNFSGSPSSVFTNAMVGTEVLYANISSASCQSGYLTQNDEPLPKLDTKPVGVGRAYKNHLETSEATINNYLKLLQNESDFRIGDWGVYYGTNKNIIHQIYGTSSCNTVSGQTPADGAMKYTENSTVEMSNITNGTNCWCKMTKYVIGDGTDSITTDNSNWVYIKSYDNSTNCAENCSKSCTDNMRRNTQQPQQHANLPFLTQVYGDYSLCRLGEYTINYHLNSGEWPITVNDNAHPEKYTILSQTITIPTPVRDSSEYNFGGWYDNPNFTGNSVTQIAGGSTGNKDLYAKWNAKSYDITYVLNPDNIDLQNGAVIDNSNNPEEYTVEDYVLLQEPTLAGYRFVRWYTQNNENEQTNITEIPLGSTGDITIYAEWEPTTYEIHYYNQDASVDLLPNTYSFGENGALGTMSQAYHRFDGWCVGQNDCETDETVLNVDPTWVGDIDLYAKWSLMTYPVKYNCGIIQIGNSTQTVPAENGETGSQETTETITYGDNYSINSMLKNKCINIPGFDFEWNCPCEKYKNTTGTGTGGAGLHHCDPEEDPECPTPCNPDEEECPAPTLGYIWENPSAECVGKWTPKPYNVYYYETYNNTDHTEIATNNPSTYTATDDVELQNATKEHYKFVEWRKGPLFKPADKITQLAEIPLTWDYLYETLLVGDDYLAKLESYANTLGDKDLLAVFTPDTYPIKYWDENGNSIQSSIPQEYQTHTYDTDTTLPGPSVMNKEHYDFVGWFATLDGTEPITAISGTEVPQDETEGFSFFGRWQKATYDINYLETNGTPVVGDLNPKQYTYGTALDDIPYTVPTKENYRFVAWCKDAQLQNCAEKQSISATDDGAKTFYAKWEQTECFPDWQNDVLNENNEWIGCESKIFNIQYKYVDESNVDGINDSYKTYTAHTEKDLPILYPDTTGYTFVGWCENKNCTEAQAFTKVLSTWEWQGDKVLYAKIVAPTVYTVSYEPNGGTITSTNHSTTYVNTDDGRIITLPTVEKDGHTFDGWCATSTLTDCTTNSTLTLPNNTTGNKTFWAKWKQTENPNVYECDSGRWLHIGDNTKACLSATKPSSRPVLAFKLNSRLTPYYLQMTPNNAELKLNSGYNTKFRALYKGTTYNIHDESVSAN